MEKQLAIIVDKISAAIDVAENIKLCLNDKDLGAPKNLSKENIERISRLNSIQISSSTKRISFDKMFLLNSLVDNTTKLLQIGTRRGSELISAIFKNLPEEVIAIDDFGGKIFSDDIKKIFINNCKLNDINFSYNSNHTLIEKHYLNLGLEKESIKKINLFFNFGESSYSINKQLIPYYYDCLDNTFTFVTDFWNKPSASEALQISIKQCNLNLIKDWHMSNGVYIATFEK